MLFVICYKPQQVGLYLLNSSVISEDGPRARKQSIKTTHVINIKFGFSGTYICFLS